MKKIGISIYPEKVGFEKTNAYVKKAAESGFGRIFVNLIEIEDDKEGNEKLAKYKEMLNNAKKLGFDVIVDVNPAFYKAFNLKPTNIEFFEDLGATGIRFDEVFDGKVEAEITNNNRDFKLEVNASASADFIKEILANGGNSKNIIACHNFYPMRYTGLDKSRFIELSARYQEMGVKVAAFVTLPQSKNNVGPWNVNEGMPTIEEHRDMEIEDQIINMLSLNVIDDIIISQQGADEFLTRTKKVIDQYEDIIAKTVIDLNIETRKLTDLESNMIYKSKNKLTNRSDFNSYFIRSTMSRVIYKDEQIKANNAGHMLKRGDVVILNEGIGRYKGEVHIILKAIDDSKQKIRNLVGSISKEDMIKINFIPGGKEFKFNE